MSTSNFCKCCTYTGSSLLSKKVLILHSPLFRVRQRKRGSGGCKMGTEQLLSRVFVFH